MVVVGPPTPPPAGGKHADLTDDEAGPYRQHLLQQQYLEVTEPLDPRLVYFQSFLGQSPTDHPGAIQEALHRAAPGRRPHAVGRRRQLGPGAGGR